MMYTIAKAYIRKSAVLFGMREYIKAIEAVQYAAEIDDGSNTKEIQQQLIKCNQALSAQRAGESEQETLERAMRDPEVAVCPRNPPDSQLFHFHSLLIVFALQKIMGDPVMQQILQQAQQDPGALQEHMKNPMVRDNIMKLVNAGIIRTR